MTTKNQNGPNTNGAAAVACTDGLGMGDRVRLLTDVPGLGSEGEIGDIIGCHPGCGEASYTVRLDKLNWRGELRYNGCAADEIEKMPNEIDQR
jgi:hypothetical protein